MFYFYCFILFIFLLAIFSIFVAPYFSSLFNSTENSTVKSIENSSTESPSYKAQSVIEFSIPGTHNSLIVPILAINTSSNTSGSQYLITESTNTPQVHDSHWSFDRPTNYIFSQPGEHSLSAWIKNENGEISGPETALVRITLSEIETVYIDPSHDNGTNEKGSMDLPYNSFTDFDILSNHSYLLKRGTTYSSSETIKIAGLENVTLATYGTGARPIFAYSGSHGTNASAIWAINASDFRLYDWEVMGDNKNIFALYRFDGGDDYNNGVLISGSSFHDSWQTPVYGNPGAQGGFALRIGKLNNFKIINSEIYNVGIDGIYAVDVPGIEIAYNSIRLVNQLYLSEPDQAYSSGDAIQLGGWYGDFHIHHNEIDRSDAAANKFNIIFNSAPGVSDSASGILEYNTFKTNNQITWAVHIERGKGIISRYNTFAGLTQGIRVAGQYTSDNLIYGNIFYDSTRGVGINSTYLQGTAYPAQGTKVYNNVFYNVLTHIWLGDASVETKNNIHYRVGPDDVALYSHGRGSWLISNNCYSDLDVAGSPGPGRAEVIGDPLFIDPEVYNFELQIDSPCIDAGTTVSLPQAYDRAGVLIPQGKGPDIGAYEY